MAEAEVALKALKAQGDENEENPEIAQAAQLLKMSTQEFKAQNYGGSLYLANQAKSLVRLGEARLAARDQVPPTSPEVTFAVPLPLKVVKTSNVREGPDIGFKVRFTFKKGTPVVGYSYKGQWVRVKDRHGQSGWIFLTLVEGR
jgi:hypothetical protein